ncbi:M48 family metallopeptidase, partial [Paracoccus sp. (in: a-proteobacteria)]|uniref:M48 family metallopeptidase n=1 Tax=Paracoccus sp. TaxID=267 RepID=UPI003A894135
LLDAQGAELVAGPIDRVEQLPGGPLLVHLPEGWVFSAEGLSPEALPGPRPDAWLSQFEAWHPRLAAVIALCLLSAWAIWRWGLDILVVLAMSVTPDAPVRAMDQSNMVIIDRLIADETQVTEARRAEVQAIFDRLTRFAPEAPWGEYHLLFRDMPSVGPNAFAMPGGTIVVNDQLLNRFDDDDVIAAVLGHEIAHVSEKHVLSQLYRAGTSYLLIALIAGDPGPFLEDMLREGNGLLALSYSRHQEADADQRGYRLANDAGYDGTALAEFFETLSDEGDAFAPTWLSSHPDLEDRAAAIRTMSGQWD